MDPNIILVNVLATIGVVKAILWLLEDYGETEGDKAPQNYNKHNNKVKPLRISKRILGMLHDEDDDEEDKDKKDKTEKEENNRRPPPRWIRIIQEEEKEEELPAEEPPAAQRARKVTESVDDETEMYLYAICICVSIILSIIILR